MAILYYRKCLGVGPYNTVDDYFADVDPSNNMRNFIQSQIDDGHIQSIEYKLAGAKNAVYCKGIIDNNSVWTTLLTNESASGYNFKVQMNMLTVTASEFEAGA
tara:strand:- start:3438 stop:3746 length:309 start_codon:yes stop_codon:yes gene_type:complete